jgi:hypothetical protein
MDFVANEEFCSTDRASCAISSLSISTSFARYSSSELYSFSTSDVSIVGSSILLSKSKKNLFIKIYITMQN